MIFMILLMVDSELVSRIFDFCICGQVIPVASRSHGHCVGAVCTLEPEFAQEHTMEKEKERGRETECSLVTLVL